MINKQERTGFMFVHFDNEQVKSAMAFKAHEYPEDIDDAMRQILGRRVAITHETYGTPDSQLSREVLERAKEILTNQCFEAREAIEDCMLLEVPDRFEPPSYYVPKKSDPKPKGFDHTKFSRRKKR